MEVHRLNIFSLKYKVLNQEIPQNQDFVCVCVRVCACARAWMCGVGEGAQTRSGDTGPTFLNEGSLYVQHALDNLPVPTGPILCF